MNIRATIVIILILATSWSIALGNDVRFHDSDWLVDSEKIDIDKHEYGVEQFKDLTDWENLDASEWTDLGKWKKQRAAKDKTLNWRELVRDSRSSELVGKVIKCSGECQYFKGVFSSTAQSLTNLREGDEFQTSEGSSAWLSLMDGTLLRVSPNSSITFNEVNISKEEVFFLIRLNYGHLQFQSRYSGEFEVKNETETDMAFYPLKLKEANREYYSIQEYRKFDKFEKLKYATVPSPGFSSQYSNLNKMIKSNKLIDGQKDSKIFFYTANTSLIVKNVNGSLFYTPNGKTQMRISDSVASFNKKTKNEQSALLQLRGYENQKVTKLNLGEWIEVDPSGIASRQMEEVNRYLATAENFLLRIPTIHLAREIFIRDYFIKILDPSHTAKTIARDHGVRLWDNSDRPEMFLRETFLKEYIRRTETTNLKSLAKIYADKNTNDTFDLSYIESAMRNHYKRIKNLHSKKHMSVREMNKNEYYLWLIRNES